MIGKFIKTALLVLIGIGVIRGVIHYNNDTGGDGINRLVMAIVHGAEDITYRWIGPLIDGIGNLVESATQTSTK